MANGPRKTIPFWYMSYQENIPLSTLKPIRVLMPGHEWLENYRAFIRPLVVVMLPRTKGLLEAPLDNRCGSHSASGALSLSRWRKVFFYLWRYGKNLGQILGDYQR